MTRRECLHRGAVLGMALPVLGTITGSMAARAAEIPTTRHLGGTIRVGLPVHAGSIDPLTVADTGAICLLSQTGEFLALSTPDAGLIPQLAESWRPNADGSVWTFKIRRGV